jgi:1-acyl-sn-glycerol-3-phosphate acyltransferase
MQKELGKKQFANCPKSTKKILENQLRLNIVETRSKERKFMTQLESSVQKTENNTPTSNFSSHYKIKGWLIRPLYPLAKYIVFPLYFGRLEITGQENVPHAGPVILAPTHRSRWDAIVTSYATGWLISRRHLRFMAMASEVRGFQGWLIERLGGFPVDPKNPGISSLRHSVELLCDLEMLTIFPEGGIFQDTVVHPLKDGLARIALQAQSCLTDTSVKIVPISIHYSRTQISWGTDLYIDIGLPIDVRDYNDGSTKQSAKHLTRDLEEALKQIYYARVNQDIG